MGPLWDSRQGEDILLALLKGLGTAAPDDYHGYLKARWAREVRAAGSLSAERHFQQSLHDGLAALEARPEPGPAFRGGSAAPAAAQAFMPSGDALELVLRPGTQVSTAATATTPGSRNCPIPSAR